MFRISRRQVDQLSEVERGRFEDKLVNHVEQLLMPQHDSKSTRLVVRKAFARALGLGLKTEIEIALFVDLMVALGRDPLEDPELRWVVEPLLDGSSDVPPNIRVRRVLSLLRS